jgi:hypothetical protein
MIFILIVGCASALAFLWAAFLFQKVRYAMINKIPLEFQDPDLGYSAYPEFALRPSTPLPLQADYLKCQMLFCFAFLGFSLCCFLLNNVIAGSLSLAFFLILAVTAIKSRKIYKANCNGK